MEKTLRC